MKPIDYLKNLVIMASADGALTEREIDWLVDRCSELGLDEADLGTALEFAISDHATMKLPKVREEQMQLLTDLIKIMAADGQLDEIEKRLFAVAAAKMNVQQKRTRCAHHQACRQRLINRRSLLEPRLTRAFEIWKNRSIHWRGT